MPKQMQPPTGGNVRVNVVMVNMEGAVTPVVASLNALVAAVQRSNGQTIVAPIKPPALPGPSSNSGNGDVTVEADPQMSLLEPSPPPAPVEESTPTPTRNRTPPKPAKVLDELRAHEGPDSFEAFVNGRNIDGVINRGLVACIWLKEKRGITQFGIDHINTCFKMMDGWTLPDDPGSLLRNMARPKEYGYVRRVNGKQGLYELTSPGENAYAKLK